jgi:hypothetical protein
LNPVGHADQPSSLNNLANRLSTRFDHRGNVEDLNESRDNLRCALTLLMQHDPYRLIVHQSLATIYLSFHRSGLDGTGGPGEDTDSLNIAMHHFKAAANRIVPGGLLPRLRASLDWVCRADQHRHATELEAYGTSMQLTDAYMSATASVSSRHNTIKDFPSTLKRVAQLTTSTVFSTIGRQDSLQVICDTPFLGSQSVHWRNRLDKRTPALRRLLRTGC